MRILVTGFGTWGSYTSNPSWDMLQNLPSSASGHQIYKGKISVVYSKIKSEIDLLIRTHQPDLIISFGLSGSIMRPRTESYGWNYGASGRDADNIALNGLLSPSKESRIGYATTYNYSTISQWLSGSSFSSYESVDAGDFLCNAMIYYTGQVLESLGKSTPFLFIHVPAVSSMPLSQQEEFGKLIITKAVQENNETIDLSTSSPVSPQPQPSPQPTDNWVELYSGEITKVTPLSFNIAEYTKYKLVSGDKEYEFPITTGASRISLAEFNPTVYIYLNNGTPSLSHSMVYYGVPMQMKLYGLGSSSSNTPGDTSAQRINKNLFTNVSSSDYTWTSTGITYRWSASGEPAGRYKFIVTMESPSAQNITIKNSVDNVRMPVSLKAGSNLVELEWDVSAVSGTIEVERTSRTYNITIKSGATFGRLV